MTMHLGKRDWQSLSYVLARKETYTALLRAFTVFEQPLAVLRDELFSTSLHHRSVGVRTPTGRVKIGINNPVDMSTLMGVFCREDYRIDRDAKVIVDIGANIGIASLYFLTRNLESFVYAFEPVPANVARFRENVAPYPDRWELFEVAVGSASGTVDFGVEPTGKFGGIKIQTDTRIEVPCVTINDVIERVLLKHSEVDCLKVDVEGSEEDILSSLDRQHWDRIKSIYAENCDSTAFMPPHFRRTHRYNVERLLRLRN